MKIVVKFGGSSLADAGQFKKVADIIHANPDRRYVVPSAPGKRFDGDRKVTDLLYDCYAAEQDPERLSTCLEAVRARMMRSSGTWVWTCPWIRSLRP